jgi:flagellar biosynthesis anti-sigma factor FlgM
MKINPHNVNAAQQGSVNDSKSTGGKRLEPVVTTATPSTPGFSSRIQSLGALVASGDVVDLAKVEAVSQAIAAGTFKVDAHAIADKMVQNSLDMLKKAE